MFAFRTTRLAVAAALVVITAPLIQAQSASDSDSATAPHLVEITAIDYAFEAPDVISEGWTTIRFRNEGEEHHMVFLARLPEGTTIDDYETQLSASFAHAWHAILEGEADQEGALAMIFEALPEWFPDLEFVGGPGLTAPGTISEVTIDLQPGAYVIECYVKNADGAVHFMEGMIRPLRVVRRAPPRADIHVTLSNYEMAVEGELRAGTRTIAVHVAENPEQGFGHSVHIARLHPAVDPDEVVEWMNWLGLHAYREPAPVEFVGGVHPMPAGHTAYLTVTLEPGRYLFVSEASGHLGVIEEVAVSP